MATWMIAKTHASNDCLRILLGICVEGKNRLKKGDRGTDKGEEREKKQRSGGKLIQFLKTFPKHSQDPVFLLSCFQSCSFCGC